MPDCRFALHKAGNMILFIFKFERLVSLVPCGQFKVLKIPPPAAFFSKVNGGKEEEIEKNKNFNNSYV